MTSLLGVTQRDSVPSMLDGGLVNGGAPLIALGSDRYALCTSKICF